jgi:hypothetical protein
MPTKHPLQTICEDVALHARSYSGRGMYGKSCLGIDVDRGGLGPMIAKIMSALAGYSEADRDTVCEAFRTEMAQDNMGLGMIYYFPSIPYTKDEEEGSEDD